MWEEACGTGLGCYVIESSHRSREASISKPVHNSTAAIKARRKAGVDFLGEKWRETRYRICRGSVWNPIYVLVNGVSPIKTSKTASIQLVPQCRRYCRSVIDDSHSVPRFVSVAGDAGIPI